MKKKLAFLLAVSVALAMTSCGEIAGDESSLVEVPEAAAAVNAETDETPVESEEETESTDETEVPAETPIVEDSQAEEEESSITVAETESSEADVPETANDANDVETYTFETPNGDYSYEQLRAQGLANKTADGVYFALISQGGGAGHAFYEVWSTVNGDWAKESDFQVANGNNTYFALDDGSILRFYYETPANETIPEVALMTFADGQISEIFNENTFADETFDDGEALDAHGNLTFSATYESGYTFWLTFTGADGGVLDKEFTLDPETLDIVK